MAISASSLQTNMMALNAGRMYGINSGEKAKTTEKLSSGYRINRAADDAAGLAISEKMRRQIRGLTQASANAQDGVSLTQTADGALNESQDILQRMNELAVQASNGTLTTEDRSFIQSEVTALGKEIDRIANTTAFNQDIYPLKGGKWIMPDCLKSVDITVNVKGVGSARYNGKVYTTGQSFVVPNVLQWTNGTQSNSDIFIGAGHLIGTEFNFNNTNEGAVVDVKYSTLDDIKYTDDGYVYCDCASDWNQKYDYFPGEGSSFYQIYSTDDLSKLKDFHALKAEKGVDSVPIQVGSEGDTFITVNFVDATTKGLEINPLDVSTQEAAEGFIDRIKTGLSKVSEYRSYFGATQNRIEATIRNLDNVVENTTEAESRIRDTDMAEEMVKYSLESILEQAGQSMISQTNQIPEGVLSLLQ